MAEKKKKIEKKNNEANWIVSYSAKLDSRTKQHTQFGVSASNGSRDMARTKVAEKKKKNKNKKKKKIEHGENYIASPTGIAKYICIYTYICRQFDKFLHTLLELALK